MQTATTTLLSLSLLSHFMPPKSPRSPRYLNISRTLTKYQIVKPHRVLLSKSIPGDIPRPPYVYTDGIETVPDKILIKNSSAIEAIAESCSIARATLNAIRDYIHVGKSTHEIDVYAQEFITSRGAYPSTLYFERFPKSICTSVNNVIAHGVPDMRRLKDGDIITVDISVYYKGYHGDLAETFLIGAVDDAGKKLVDVARDATYAGIEICAPGRSFATIGRRIKEVVEKAGFKFNPYNIGHGVGESLHEHPYYNYTKHEEVNETMASGMVFTVEPIVTEGSFEERLGSDGLCTRTKDDSRAAQFEHTILITDQGYKILT